MNGKSYSLSLGMLFKKYHCAKCGAVLKTEQTHRVVTKDDKDYYEFHDRGTFPLHDYDVYNYRFKCPNCHARISYNEQCIIERIQKQQGYHVLAGSEIKTYYKACKEQHMRSTLISRIVCAVIFILFMSVLFYLFGSERTTQSLTYTAILSLAAIIIAVIGVIGVYNGHSPYVATQIHSFEKKVLLEKLRTCSSNNRQTIAISDRCYCFHCKASMDHSEITDFLEDGQTAICPHCGVDAILPDYIDENINEDVVSQMHDYWF